MHMREHLLLMSSGAKILHIVSLIKKYSLSHIILLQPLSFNTQPRLQYKQTTQHILWSQPYYGNFRMRSSLSRRPNDATTPTSKWSHRPTSGQRWMGSLSCSAQLLTGRPLGSWEWSVTTSRQSTRRPDLASLPQDIKENHGGQFLRTVPSCYHPSKCPPARSSFVPGQVLCLSSPVLSPLTGCSSPRSMVFLITICQIYLTGIASNWT